ncbi:MAG: glycosyltransferase family 39 protein [Gemmatimonadaceae bacterium]|nr:glycosyltransferase family 39 protein [Gemmatimonadaceae bacterium]
MPPRPAIEELNRRLGWALPAIATLVLGIFRLPELTRSSLWYDELFSMGVAGLPAAEALRRVVADHTNPPLFYVLLKGWMAIGGDSDHWVRLLPCVLAMLLGAALVWLAREARVDARAGMLAVALAAASPLSVDLANEVRGYSLLALLACLSLAATLHDRTRRTRETFALMTMINIALVHTHYFGWLTIGAECVAAAYAWPRPHLWRVLRSAGLTLIAFVPWAAAVAAHALSNPAPLRNVAWITSPDAAAPLWLLRDLTGRSGIASVDMVWVGFVVIALVMLAVAQWRRREVARQPLAAGRVASARADAVADGAPAEGALPLLALAGLAAPVLVWAVSLASGHSFWVQRYLVGAAAPVALLTAIALSSLPPRRWGAAAVAGFIWTAVACAALPQRSPTKFDWRRFVRRVDMSVGSPRDVYALEAFTGAPLLRYAHAGMQLHMVKSLQDLPSGDVWLVYRRDSFADGSPAAALRTLGFTTVTSLSAETAGQKIVAVRIRR